MTGTNARKTRIIGLLLIIALVASCGLPRSGPKKREIEQSSVERAGNAYIVNVDDRVTRLTNVQLQLGFSRAFLAARVLPSDMIRPGDTLGLGIWENVDDGLLASQGANASTLDELQVDSEGYIYVPYAGRVKAAGNTPESLRQLITGKLDTQTPDPQVLVRRLAGDGATVSLFGGVGMQGVFAIERPTRTLSAMLARAGGVTIAPEVAQITIIRGSRKSTIWFEDLFRNPKFDIALRAGDRILVEQDKRSYTVLGATRAQTRVQFETKTISAVEAMARVGGLNSALANPKGVFIFRDEDANIANQVLNRTDLVESQRFAYMIDLTKPTGLFEARDFVIRDGDTIYVTEAPFVTWNKTISALTGSLQSANALTTAAGVE